MFDYRKKTRGTEEPTGVEGRIIFFFFFLLIKKKKKKILLS
jgi:hypothetical protein